MRLRHSLPEAVDGIGSNGNGEHLVIMGLTGSFKTEADAVRAPITIQQQPLRGADFEEGDGAKIGYAKAAVQSAWAELQSIELFASQPEKLSQFTG